MVVKSAKRKSMNSSGAWEVETLPSTPNPVANKKPKLDVSSNQKVIRTENKLLYTSMVVSSPPAAEKQQEEIESSPKQDEQNDLNENLNQQNDLNENLEPDVQTRPQEHNLSEPVEGFDYRGRWEMLSKWPKGDFLTLVIRVEEECKSLLSEKYSEVLDKIDWSKIIFGGHTSQECQEAWIALLSKARRTPEKIDEAREMLLHKELVPVPKPQFLDNTPKSNTKISFEDDDNDDDDDDDNDDDSNKAGEEEDKVKSEVRKVIENSDDNDGEEEEEEEDDDDDDDDEDEEEEDDDDDEDDNEGEQHSSDDE